MSTRKEYKVWAELPGNSRCQVPVMWFDDWLRTVWPTLTSEEREALRNPPPKQTKRWATAAEKEAHHAALVKAMNDEVARHHALVNETHDEIARQRYHENKKAPLTK